MRLEVPVYRQEEPWSCLAACIRMALAFVGEDLTEAEIRQVCQCSPLGTRVADAAAGLEQLGLATRWSARDARLQTVFETLASGLPVICSQLGGISHGGAVRHAVVVCGADDEVVYFVDPYEGAEASRSLSSFYERWLLSGGDTLVVEGAL